MSFRFQLGQILATPAALETCKENEMSVLLGRHLQGDWGDVPEADKRINEAAVKIGARILSAYTLHGTKLWVITEADRSATTVLLPSEY